jgi:HEAT repeat protein
MKDRISRRCCGIFIFFTLATLFGTRAQTDSAPEIRVLMEQLNDVRTVRADTVKQILEIAGKDPRAREYVVQRLPDLIGRPESDVWLDAIRLAGKLKAKEAIPALQQAMSRHRFAAEPFLTFAGIWRLDNDIVAKALSQIGDPAIPAATSLLRSEDAGMRYRATLILRNIGSRSARVALRDRLPHESDPEVKKLIRDSLRP